MPSRKKPCKANQVRNRSTGRCRLKSRRKSRRKTSRRKTPTRGKPSSRGTVTLNKFFEKIFVISLFDKLERYTKVLDQFKAINTNIERFVAVDGRCKDQGEQGCLDKLRSFEMGYNVRIPVYKDINLQEIVPAASLTIGTIVLLRNMVKNKWSTMLICEDDVELTPDLMEKFSTGVREMGSRKWDVLYLGCGNKCGNEGVSYEKRPGYELSEVSKVYKKNYGEDAPDDIYVTDSRDLREPCEDDCTKFSEHLTWAWTPGGTWAYAYSLQGARKMLKLLDNDAGNHIDQLLAEFTSEGYLKTLAFDPPLIMHEHLDIRTSDIPWEW